MREGPPRNPLREYVMLLSQLDTLMQTGRDGDGADMIQEALHDLTPSLHEDDLVLVEVLSAALYRYWQPTRPGRATGENYSDNVHEHLKRLGRDYIDLRHAITEDRELNVARKSR